jgi:proline iminopeptidase
MMIDDMARVIRFEQRGCDRSDLKPPYDVATYLTDLENVRQHYQIERWIIGGHSWGADLALAYALEDTSHIAGLICITGGRIHNDREWHQVYRRRKEQEGEVQRPVQSNTMLINSSLLLVILRLLAGFSRRQC